MKFEPFWSLQGTTTTTPRLAMSGRKFLFESEAIYKKVLTCSRISILSHHPTKLIPSHIVVPTSLSNITHHPSTNLFNNPSVNTLTHSPIYPLIHSLTHPSSHSSIHSLIHPPTHPFTHPPIHPPTHPSTYPPTHHPSIHPLISLTTTATVGVVWFICPPPQHPSTTTLVISFSPTAHS